MKDVVVNEVKKKIISVEDFKKYFDSRKIISLKEYGAYLNTKSGKSREK